MSPELIGARMKRYGGLDHAAGRTQFVDDLRAPGMLAAKVLRSPVAKGDLLHIDTSAARGLPGVAAVITAADVPHNIYGPGRLADQPVLARAIRFRGEPLAAVAAIDEDTAREALELIRIDIREQPAVFDPLEAMADGAPKVRPEGNLFLFGPHPFMYAGEKPCREICSGSLEQGFASADRIIEGEYRQASVEHAALEPQCCLAVPAPDGSLTVHTMSQHPWLHRMELCAVLQMAPHRVRSVSTAVGGGFGGKSDMHADPVAALLALKTGRPVKWRWTRQEELLYSTHRGAWRIRFRDAVTNDGRILARDVRSIRDGGAYACYNYGCIESHCSTVAGPYAIANVRIQGYLVYTNKPPAMTMRGFGVNEAAYACESQMNRIAAELGMDPLELRLINAYRNGDIMPNGHRLESVALVEVLQETARAAGIELPAHLQAMSSQARTGDL